MLPYTPGGPANVAIVSLPALLDRASTLAPVVGRLQVYLSDPGVETSVRDALLAQGISIKDTQRQGDRQALYDSSASAWGCAWPSLSDCSPFSWLHSSSSSS